MRILAIDPGPVKSAWVIWDGKEILAKAITQNKDFPYNLENLPGIVPFDEAVIEMVASYGMPVGQTIFETCVWTGRLMQLIEFARYFQIKTKILYRKDVLSHICNDKRARDSNVRQALIDRFGPPGTKKTQGLTYGLHDDLWAAFAVAVTWWDLNQSLNSSHK